jgi:hypothetical protein
VTQDNRHALLVCSHEYFLDKSLRRLKAPANDVAALAAAISNPAIGDFRTEISENESASATLERIEEFLLKRTAEQTVLLYFSGHGIKGPDGELYFAMSNTRLGLLRTSSVKARDVHELLRSSRARRQVLVLDCCYSGAFVRGMVVKDGGSASIADNFAGKGHVVLTASDSIQYSFEEDDVRCHVPSPSISVFTRAIVDGLNSGDADVDGDGVITVDELYDYVQKQLRTVSPHQSPRKWAWDQDGKIVIATVPPSMQKPCSLDDELLTALTDHRSFVRRACVDELSTLANGSHPGRAVAALSKLRQISEDDDSRSVALAARSAIERHSKGRSAVVATTQDESADAQAKAHMGSTPIQNLGLVGRSSDAITEGSGSAELAKEPSTSRGPSSKQKTKIGDSLDRRNLFQDLVLRGSRNLALQIFAIVLLAGLLIFQYRSRYIAQQPSIAPAAEDHKPAPANLPEVTAPESKEASVFEKWDTRSRISSGYVAISPNTLGLGSVRAEAVNSSGDIVGCDTTPLHWSAAAQKWSRLDSLGHPGCAYGINDMGRIVGHIDSYGSAVWITSSSEPKILDRSSREPDSGIAINSDGIVVGKSSSASSTFSMWRPPNYTPKDIDAGINEKISSVFGINNRNEVLYSALSADNTKRLVVSSLDRSESWRFFGFNGSSASINSSGVVVGLLQTGTYEVGRIFVWTYEPNRIEYLPMDSRRGSWVSVQVNDSGLIAGWQRCTRGEVSRLCATLWDPISRAFEQLPSSSPQDEIVRGVNNRGDVVGYMDPDGTGQNILPIIWKAPG